MSDDDDMDISAAFIRMVRVMEKQALDAKRIVHGFDMEIPSDELRTMLVAHAKLLRAKHAELMLLPTFQELSERHCAAYGCPDPNESSGVRPPMSMLGTRPTVQSMSIIELQADFCVTAAARLTDSSKVFRLNVHDWGQLFSRPDIGMGMDYGQ